MEPHAELEASAARLGFDLSPHQIDRLLRLAEWLEAEAIPAGGLGPAEGGRILQRHIVDSLAMAVGFDRFPREVADLGCGVGLPGLVLAVAFPESGLTLVDRSSRRVSLARRAIRVLDLPNAEVVQGEVEKPVRRFPGVVARAVMPPERLLDHLHGWIEPGGRAVVAGSSRRTRAVEGYRTLEVGMLDPPTWLLIMAA
ncbi:MAG: hypothetical protein KatS3mg011_2154 [Acidimicrobiia bacterium]|nr:MAG: hypothetical protein KatS3mg011_2154 [Acidimicrobiia bacterium]